MPRPPRPVLTKTCALTACPNTFTTRRDDQEYCCTAHQQAAHVERRQARGYQPAAPSAERYSRSTPALPGSDLGRISPSRAEKIPLILAVVGTSAGSRGSHGLTAGDIAAQVALSVPALYPLLRHLRRIGRLVSSRGAWYLAPDDVGTVDGCRVTRRPDGAVEIRLGIRAVCLTASRATPERIISEARRLTARAA